MLARREAEPEVQAPVEEEEEAEEEDESEWETDTDEDDVPGRKLIKPMFVPKARASPKRSASANPSNTVSVFTPLSDPGDDSDVACVAGAQAERESLAERDARLLAEEQEVRSAPATPAFRLPAQFAALLLFWRGACVH
jgi:hypothetical protein